jgi:ubiquitin C-terminal hydrolase
MNSVIQQLYMIPDFRYGIISSEVTQEEKDLSTLFQMQLIFANLQETEKKYYAAKGFTKAFRFAGEPVDVRKQQDATEFFSVLSDTLETELKGTAQEKLLSEILGGEIVNEIKSLEEEYEYISQRPEPFFSIQLDIKNKKSIEEALDSYVKPDILEGDNKYHCEEYDKKIKVQKRAFLNKTSNTLIINLKRFEFDYTTFRRYKVNDY